MLARRCRRARSRRSSPGSSRPQVTGVASIPDQRGSERRRANGGNRRGPRRAGHRGRGGGIGRGLRLGGRFPHPRTAGPRNATSQPSSRPAGPHPASGATTRAGVCVIGVFRSTGAAAAFSKATVFRAGTSRLLGRFSLGSPQPAAPEASTRVRGFAFRITAPGGSEWRECDGRPAVLPRGDARGLPGAAAGRRRARSQRDGSRRRGASGAQDIRCLGEVGALDAELRRGALQQPRRVRGDRRAGRYASPALVAAADDAGRYRDACGSLPPSPRISSTRTCARVSPARRSAGPWC